VSFYYSYFLRREPETERGGKKEFIGGDQGEREREPLSDFSIYSEEEGEENEEVSSLSTHEVRKGRKKTRILFFSLLFM